MIDLSKLPAPKLIEELDYEAILSEMRTKMRALCPEWTGYELESDPANKILEVAAYREMLLRQRVNEAARGVMIAFAQGSDLDQLAGFYPEVRLPGAAATFTAALLLSTAFGTEVTVPKSYRVVSQGGKVTAELSANVTIPPGETSGVGLFEVLTPQGSDGNGMSLSWDAVTPLPFVTGIRQEEPTHGGSNTESDEDFRVRIPQALEKYSTAGPRGAYESWADGADERIKDVRAISPTPGDVVVVLLSEEGNGTADEAMISRVYAVLSDEKVRPLTDRVSVVSAEIVPYEVRISLELYSGVAGGPPEDEARRRVEAHVAALHLIGKDIIRSAIIAASHTEGIKSVELLEPATDIHITDTQAASCALLEISSRIAAED